MARIAAPATVETNAAAKPTSRNSDPADAGITRLILIAHRTAERTENQTILAERHQIFLFHPPSEALGGSKNERSAGFSGRAGLTIDVRGSVWLGLIIALPRVPSPATLTRADPPQAELGEGKFGGDEREGSVFLL